MDPHSFIARAEAQRWLGIAEKLLMGHDLVGSKTFAIRARDSDPRLEAAEQILAIADTLLAAEKRVVGNNGAQQPDYYAILQLVRFVQDTDHIASQFRRLAVMLNPHQNRFPYSDQAFQLVNDAWAVLSNPMRKSMYDSELDFPPQQQMNNLGFNLEQHHHHQHQQHHQQHQQHHHQQQQQHNFFSINHMGASHEQELSEPQQTFQTRVQQQQQLQQHNFLSQPSPVRQEQLFQHREQEQLFQPQPQPQTQPFQISSPPHQQTRQPQPPPQVQPFQVTSPPTHQQTRQPLQLPKREQEQLFHHREQEQLFQPQAQLPFQVASPPQQQQPRQPPPPQPQVQPFQISSPPHQQTRKQQQQQPPPQPQVQPFQVTSSQHQQTRQPPQPPQPQPRIQSPSPPPPAVTSQPPFSWTQEPPHQSQPSPPPLVAAPQPPFSWTQAPPQQQQQPPPSQPQPQPQPQPPPPQPRPQIQPQPLPTQPRPQPQPQPQEPPPQSRPPPQSQTPAPQSRPQPQPQLQSQPPPSQSQPPPQPQLQQHQQHLQPQSQQLQQKQEQPQPPPPPQPQQQQESLEQNAATVELPTQVNSDNGVMDEEIETETEEPAEIVDDSPTFWTSCPFCFYMYEYPRIYAECTLRCDHCQRAFQAVRISSPPPIIEGQEAYFCCWGYFPLGVSMSHLEKNNNQGNKKTWTPFSPMYNASGNNVQNQNHLNGNAAPKENTFVNKSSGPRIHLDDDIDDDVFMDVSESSDDSYSDSDGEWVGTRKKKMKKDSKLNRAHVLGISARDAKNGMIKNLENGMPVQESGKKDVGGIPRRQSGRVGKELGKLDLNVEFNNNEGHGHGQGADDNVEGNGFFEGLDEFLSSLPILSVVNEEKVKAA